MFNLLVYFLVTEKEVKQGLLDMKDANKHCLWFHRTLRGIDKAEPSRLVSRYTGLIFDKVVVFNLYLKKNSIATEFIPIFSGMGQNAYV